VLCLPPPRSRLLTDNGPGYKSHDWRDLCAELGLAHTRIRPYRPQTNGKVERFNRTLADEWAYVRAYRSEADRSRRFDRWLHDYNHHRGHTALNGLSPIEAVNNRPSHHT
jgi:transposase InsO family protein